MSPGELVSLFADIAAAQYKAIWIADNKRYNKLFKKMREIIAEIDSRPGRLRKMLVTLYGSDNPFVRYKAATFTVVVDPAKAKKVIQEVAGLQNDPAGFEAGMTLFRMDDADYAPP